MYGKLKTRGAFEENFWATKDEVVGKLDIYDDFEFNEHVEAQELTFEESVAIAEGY